MKCPKCGLYNPDRPVLCDCGYSFKERKIKESYKEQNTNKRQWFWNKTYTLQSIMKESRSLLVFVALANILMGYILYSEAKYVEAEENAIGMGIVGLIFFIAAIIPSYWFRFICISVWILDLFYTNIVMSRMRGSSIVFMTIGTIYAYKMWKYRNVLDEKDKF